MLAIIPLAHFLPALSLAASISRPGDFNFRQQSNKSFGERQASGVHVFSWLSADYPY